MSRALVLRHGPLAFSALERGRGPLVLLLHGFPDTPNTWQLQLGTLADAGYRAVAVAMRGYEPSSQPADGNYQLTALADDVAAWIEQLGETRVHLVGHDWGAAVGYATAARHASRIASLTALAVPPAPGFAAQMLRSPIQIWRSRYILRVQRADAAERLRAHDFAWLEALWRSWSPGWDVPAEQLASAKRQFALPGVVEAALAWYRQGVDSRTDAGKASRALAAASVPVPTLAAGGLDDACVGARVFRRSFNAASFPAGLRLEQLEDAGHFVHLEQPARFNALLLDWLRAHSR